MKEVVGERFVARPQALHSRLNEHAGKRPGRSIQWIDPPGGRRLLKGE
jgi:hypothetical protein